MLPLSLYVKRVNVLNNFRNALMRVMRFLPPALIISNTSYESSVICIHLRLIRLAISLTTFNGPNRICLSINCIRNFRLDALNRNEICLLHVVCLIMRISTNGDTRAWLILLYHYLLVIIVWRPVVRLENREATAYLRRHCLILLKKIIIMNRTLNYNFSNNYCHRSRCRYLLRIHSSFICGPSVIGFSYRFPSTRNVFRCLFLHPHPVRLLLPVTRTRLRVPPYLRMNLIRVFFCRIRQVISVIRRRRRIKD